MSPCRAIGFGAALGLVLGVGGILLVLMYGPDTILDAIA